ncbi:peptidase [bacterium]|nr:peptidase [bacterium]
MGLFKEYIDKKMGPPELQAELKRLIDCYNKHQNTYLFIYYSTLDKPIPDSQMVMSDYYVIHDFLNGKSIDKIDVFLQTPGGSGEAAEEIVRILRKKTNHVSFVIAGEAKSAGTILALSGNEILMTNTGSLGPIDAQVKLGRSVISAFDYVEWVNTARAEAMANGTLNPFDATIVAQITPGELSGIFHSLKFAEDLVVEWLPKYKFADWEKTEERQISVTQEMKETRAREVVEQLINHARWRSHGRSIKIEDLEPLLKIQKIDDDPVLADIVYRIDVVLRLICETTSAFKIFMTSDSKIFRHATQGHNLPQIPIPPKDVNIVNVDQVCPKCGFVHKIYAKTKPDPRLDEQAKRDGFKPFPKDCKIACTCGQEIDILGLKNQIESQIGVKLII